MKSILVMCMLSVVVALSACSEPQDRISNVGWMSDGEIAVVQVTSADGDRKSFRIRCKDYSVKTPFGYGWEDDCDLNTEFRGFVQDWDNPEDERFEDRRYSGSNEGYDDDDDGIDLGDVAIGMVAGDMLSKKKKTKTKVVTRTVVKKPVRKTTPRKTTTRRTTRRR